MQQLTASCGVITFPLLLCGAHCIITGGGDFKSPEQFKLCLPQRTNYLYGRITKSLPEMYAFTLCMWIKSSATPGIGTPFSYGVPGQANEIVLIEWGNNPIELLINDKASGFQSPQSIWSNSLSLSPKHCSILSDVLIN